VYDFNNPLISKSGNYSVISFQGAVNFGETGKATLPFLPVNLLLPPGEIASSISIEFDDQVTIPGEFELLPRQEVRPLSDTVSHAWKVDYSFYRSSRSYPSELSYRVETQFYNGCGIALSAFTPLRYLPVRNEVSYYRRVTVTIQTAPDPESTVHMLNFFQAAGKATYLQSLVQNPGMVSDYYPGRDLRTADYDYLIITPNQYLSEFDTLAEFYRPRGIRTKLKSTESIASTIIGADLQEKIRKYIIMEYQAHGIEYVLIGGDAELVPYRGFYCHVYSDIEYSDFGIPADLYYSALDGTWNTDGDNKWGEPGEDDLYPELGIGRMTFGDTVELHNMLHKTILYQANPVEGEMTRPLLAGEYLYNQPWTWGSDYLRLLVGYRTDNGYTTQGIPPSHPRDTLYDECASWPKDTLRAHINSGRPWLHHVGHSNYTYAMKLYDYEITNANFAQANGVNHNYTIVYTHGCNCGGFDVNDCIAEKMIGIDNFAVAFIGNSRYGWFNQGTTDGPSEHLHREFLDAVYRDSLYHAGMAHMKSKSETAPFVDISGEFEPGATRWCFYDNNLLGDPVMAMWTEEPYSVQASFPAMVKIGSDSVVAFLTGTEGACKNFTCSLYRNDTLFGTDLSNSAGKAVIIPDEELTEGPMQLIVTGPNVLPQSFEIHISDYWLGLTNDWNSGMNWFTGAVPDTGSYIIIPANPAGGRFPLKNSANLRQCKRLQLETGAQIRLGPGETFSVGND
jgi:hypothetical protein